MNALRHPITEDWLARFDRAAAALPRPRRAELRAELLEHLDAAVAEGEEPATVLARLGDPAEIVAAEDLPAPSPARTRAATALLVLPLTGLLVLALPGLLSVAAVALGSATALVLVLRAGLTGGARALGVLGALAPVLAGLGAGLTQVLQHAPGPGTSVPLGQGKSLSVLWQTDPWVLTLGQLALLLLGAGLPVLAGLLLRRAEGPLPLGSLFLLLIPGVGLATALLLTGLDRKLPLAELARTPLLAAAALTGVLVLACGALLITRGGLDQTAKALVALAVLTAPLGVALLAQPTAVNGGITRETAQHPLPADPAERRRVVSAWVDEAAATPLPPQALPPRPFWAPADREVRLGLGLVLLIALPLTAAWRIRRVRA